MKGTVQEADLKSKAGTAWSHSYLNQKPWHPLSYPNQKRKWIAEQTHQQRQLKSEEVAREFAQEQEFFRQTAMLSKKEQEKAEVMQALSFMYLRPPGYNAESARAAEIADEMKKSGVVEEQSLEGPPPAGPMEEIPERKKPRVLDIYGRPVPTEEEFPALRNAPRLQTGTIARAKPFGVEIRNVKCARCGSFGHQSGDRECVMKDAIMPNEQARLQRDDPLNAIMANSSNNKWELKQQIGGMSPPRGGFKPDDPNQQIIPEDDVYDEYGGFLAGDGFADAVASRLKEKKRQKERKKKRKRDAEKSESDSDGEENQRRDSKQRRSRKYTETTDESDRERKDRNHRSRITGDESDREHKDRKHRNRISDESEREHQSRDKNFRDSEHEERRRERRPRRTDSEERRDMKHKSKRIDDSKPRHESREKKCEYGSRDSESDRQRRREDAKEYRDFERHYRDRSRRKEDDWV